MKVIKLKKRFKIFLIVFSLSVILILFSKYPKNYKIDYKVKNINIMEQYNKYNKQYIIKFKNNGVLYEYSFKHNYLGKKRIINSIKRDNTCITPVSKKVKLYTLCYDQKGKYFYYNNQTKKTKTRKLKHLVFNSSKKIYLWNHKGYTILNSNKKINFLKKEIYYNDLVYKYKDFLLTPDYESKNRFTKFYVINMDNSKLFVIKSKYKISYDYYYLGTFKDNIYIVDKRTRKEYSIDLKKKKVLIITNNNDDGKIWNGKWEDISMTKLVAKEQSFQQNNIYNYYLKNKQLFVTYNHCSNKVLVTNKKVDKILYENENEIYYLVKNKVYYSSPSLKDIFILKYDELVFNSDNQVFLS